MQQDDFRALLSAPRASGGSSRYDQTVALGRKASRQGTSAKDALALPPRSHSKSGQSKTGTSNSGAGAVSGGRLGASASEERLGVDKMLDILRETNPDMTEEQLRQLAGEGGPRGLDMSYIAQAKQQQAGRQNAQAESALDDMLDDSLQTEPSTAVPPKKRSRDEILRSLRAGNSNLEQASTQESSKPSKFRKVGAPAEAPVVPTDKKVKKKKKASSKSSSAAIDHPAPVPRPSFLPKPTDPAPAPIPAPQINDTEDLDIFAGEAEYSGLSDSDSDEPSRSDKGKQRQKEEYIEQQRPVKKGTWFNDDLDDQADAIQAPVMPQPAPAPTPDSDEEEDENAQRRAEIRAMLDADKAAEKAEKRREAKQRWKEKQGLGGREFGEEVNRPKEGKKLNDKEKLNREYQQLQSRLDKGDSK